MSLRPHHFESLNTWVVVPGALLALAVVAVLGAAYLILSVAGSPVARSLVPNLRMAGRALAFFILLFVIVGIFSVRGG